MNTKLHETIHELASQHHPSIELKAAVMKKVVIKKSSSKVNIFLSVALIALTIPLVAFINQYFYADQLFGSYAQLEGKQISMSMTDYNRLDNKISRALSTLEAKDGLIFLEGLKDTIQFKLKYGNSEGAINHFELTEQEYEQYFNIIASVQPYFDILNGFASSKFIFEEDEFRIYIESIILQESITAASNIGYEDYRYSRVAPEYEQQYDELIQTIVELERKLSQTLIIDGVDYRQP